MMRLLNRVFTRILLLAVLALGALVALGMFVMSESRNNLYEQKKADIRHVVEAVATALNKQKKSLNGSKLLVLGVAYKKDVDDLRESPTLKIMQLLQGRGAHVEYNDPYFPQLHRMRHYNYEGMKSVPLSPQTLGAYDGVIIATDHSTYDYNAIVDSSKLVVDTRNATRRVVRHRNRIALC